MSYTQKARDEMYYFVKKLYKDYHAKNNVKQSSKNKAENIEPVSLEKIKELNEALRKN